MKMILSVDEIAKLAVKSIPHIEGFKFTSAESSGYGTSVTVHFDIVDKTEEKQEVPF